MFLCLREERSSQGWWWWWSCYYLYRCSPPDTHTHTLWSDLSEVWLSTRPAVVTSLLSETSRLVKPPHVHTTSQHWHQLVLSAVSHAAAGKRHSGVSSGVGGAFTSQRVTVKRSGFIQTASDRTLTRLPLSVTTVRGRRSSHHLLLTVWCWFVVYRDSKGS